MQKGKVAAQCGHAAVAAYATALIQQPELLNHWMNTGRTMRRNGYFHIYLSHILGGAKVTLRLNSEEEMLEIHKKAKQMGILSSIVRDAGHTQVAPGSKTVIAIGPAPKTVLEQITKDLALY